MSAGLAADAPLPDTPWQERRYRSFDGLILSVRDYGDASNGRLPVVCLPGLTRSVRDFHALAMYLANHRERPRRVVAFDYRGRGRSEWDRNAANYNVGVELADIADGMATLGIPQAAIVGTSRGGIIGMLMAFSRPQTVAALVLNDIGPLIDPRGLLRLKSYVGRTPAATDWAAAARIQQRLHGAHFPGLDEAGWMEFARLIYRDEDQRPVIDYDPRLADTLAAVDGQTAPAALWNEFRALDGLPILVLRGANSDMLSAATLEQMAAEHMGLETLVVPDEGHPPILKGNTILRRIGDFVAAAEERPGAWVRPAPAEATSPAD